MARGTATTLVALLFFRAEDRYGLLVLDGALIAGSLLAIGLV